MKRRAFLGSPLILAAGDSAAVEYPAVLPGASLEFPRDHGSHPRYRTEWWYITGWTRASDGVERGMQITFFRSRTGIGEDNPSRFAPSQLLFAHAALADRRNGRLLHDQRAARAGFGLAEAGIGRTDVRIDDWSLKLTDAGYVARVAARDFAFALQFQPTQPPLLQGERGYSRKGPHARQASYYYSRPQLAIGGTIQVKGEGLAVAGTAWLDHEWSSEALASDAVGWDWVGLNLSDGGALMAFRMRDRRGGTFWAGGARRGADGRTLILAPAQIGFEPLRRWRSPRTQAEYPVALRLRAGDSTYELEPLMDDQELDSRASTGTVYWEGAVRARKDGRQAGAGYLELTGYWKPVRF
ncbi:MAG: carotenoid 1,2-hydratase [Betaproteobacteria bacterium]|nr:carotenoid 1,2-hydratase [Betaproteobacteria bacterium]